VKIRVEFFWVVMPCSVVIGYQEFRGICCLHLQGECGSNMDFWKVGILPQNHTASQLRTQL